jgi:hypothetical protein
MEKIQAPEAPILPGFSDEKRAEWQQSWIDAFSQAQVDHPGDETTQRAVATREANRILRVKEPKTYDDAMKLKDWQIVKRVEEGGNLKVVTIDGKKYVFSLPPARAAAAKAPEDKKPPEDKK